MGLLLAAFGVFAILGAALDWEWFMNNYKARFMTSILTRTGARIFYCLLGGGLVVMGILMAMGIIRDSN